MKERLCLLKRLYAKKTLTVALTLAAFFVFTASPTNAQCTRPIVCGAFGSCYSVNWLVDSTFSEYCGNGWTTSGGALRVTGSGVCGWSGNQYVKFFKPPFSNTGQLVQTFTHDGSYTNSNFYLSFMIEGGNSQDYNSWLSVSIYNVTDNTWTYIDSFDYSNAFSECQHKSYSFYKPEWRGKQLSVVFDSTIYSSTTWRVDYVALDQSTQ